jgi:hypothetical protein
VSSIDDLAAAVRRRLDEREIRLRDGWYSDTHWNMLTTRAILGGWTVSRQNGVSTQLNDEIVNAAVEHARATFDRWQADYAQADLAEVASKRALLDEALAWEHGLVRWDHNQVRACESVINKPCDCGRDARVHAVLTHLAQPYQETT